jgi:predicted nucleotidyltransferase
MGLCFLDGSQSQSLTFFPCTLILQRVNSTPYRNREIDIMRPFAAWSGGSAEERALLVQCRQAVRAIVPSAAIILYGSRARGDGRTDSDDDLLVVVDSEVDWRLEDQIRQCLYPLELATGAALTMHAYSRTVWDSPLYRAMPFTQHVERDGIVL